MRYERKRETWARPFANGRAIQGEFMPKTKTKPKAIGPPKLIAASECLATLGKEGWIPASEVRRKCGGVSPVTLWRWRHDPELGFPVGKIIRGRWYFPLGAVLERWSRQPQQRQEAR